MGSKMVSVKGRVEEAAGARTEDENLKSKDKTGQLVSKMKAKAAKATEKMRSALAGKTLPNRTK